jgi:hypothetical protein
MRLRTGAILMLLAVMMVLPATAQEAESSSRDETRQKLRDVLESAGKRADVGVTFHQSKKEPYNFIGTMTDKLANAESLEIVIRVTSSDTINFRVFPHYKDKYVNVRRAKDGPGLMRKLLQFNYENFLYWGADEADDVFSGYTFTLESGFPEEAITIVLRSIRSTDGFVGDLRPYIDGSASATAAK